MADVATAAGVMTAALGWENCRLMRGGRGGAVVGRGRGNWRQLCRVLSLGVRGCGVDRGGTGHSGLARDGSSAGQSLRCTQGIRGDTQSWHRCTVGQGPAAGLWAEEYECC